MLKCTGLSIKKFVPRRKWKKVYYELIFDRREQRLARKQNQKSKSNYQIKQRLTVLYGSRGIKK